MHLERKFPKFQRILCINLLSMFCWGFLFGFFCCFCCLFFRFVWIWDWFCFGFILVFFSFIWNIPIVFIWTVLLVLLTFPINNLLYLSLSSSSPLKILIVISMHRCFFFPLLKLNSNCIKETLLSDLSEATLGSHNPTTRDFHFWDQSPFAGKQI